MFYSVISGLALILNLITNRGVIKNLRASSGAERDEQQTVVRYSWFIIVSNCYFFFDMFWGFLYEHHDNSILFPLLYLDTVLYFIFLYLTMLSWNHYMVSYLKAKGRRSEFLLYAAFALFVLALLYLLVNFFYPVAFSFNQNREYVPHVGRYITFILQFALYVATSTYIFCISHKSIGQEKTRHVAVGLTCIVMEFAVIMQILFPEYPFYSMGLLIGICVIHSYVELGARKEKEIYDNLARALAEDYAAMYYIDIETGEYQEFAISQEYVSMAVPAAGRDFYAEVQANIGKYTYPDDAELARTLHKKEKMLENLEGRTTFSYKYKSQ